MTEKKKQLPTIAILDITKIDPPAHAMRQTFHSQELTELAESILKVGLLQPIVVVPHGSRYTIVAGHRRYVAALQATLKEIPCIVTDYTESEAAIATVHENLYRRDVTPLEKAAYYVHLMTNYNWTVADVAAKVGESYQKVNDHINLMKADELTINALMDNLISFTHAKILLQEKDVAKRQYYLRNCVDSGVNVNILRRWVVDGIIESLPQVTPMEPQATGQPPYSAAGVDTTGLPHVIPPAGVVLGPPQNQQPIFCAICHSDIPAGKEIVLALCQMCYNKIYGSQEAEPDQKGKGNEKAQSETNPPST